MKLISKTHDYYDSVFRNYSSEDKHVFVRKNDEIKLDKRIERVSFDSAQYNDIVYEFDAGVIGFCGEIHPFIRVHQKDLRSTCDNTKVEYVYSLEDFNKVVIGFKDKNLVKPKYRRYSYSTYGSFYDKVRNFLVHHKIDRFRDKVDLDSYSLITNIFTDQKIAYFKVFMSTNVNQDIEIYPVLADYQFFRVYDIFKTYQKLEYYFCNILVAPDDPYIEPIDDKTKAQSKGFNRFSFRKDKQKKATNE